MTFSIILSREIKCDTTSIIRLVNNLQLFFIAEPKFVRVDLPSKPLDELSFTEKEISNILAQSGFLQPAFPEQQYLLLTSRNVDPIHSYTKNGPAIISECNKSCPSKDSRTLWFATQIVRCGLIKIIANQCQKTGCACSRQEDFYFLCESCEHRLRDCDYRDAVIHLKNTIQWLNERLSSRHPDLSRKSNPHIPAELHLAAYYARLPENSQIFHGKCVLMVLHFLSDLVPFVNALHKMGSAYSDMILVAKPYPYPKRDYVSHHLQRLGVRVYRATKQYPVDIRARDVLRDLASADNFKQKKIVVIEDGGYFTPLLHRHEFRQLCTNCIGTVEQTTKGIVSDEAIHKLKMPILNVAKSSFKSRYEAPEIGRVTVQNITRFVPNTKLSSGHAIVFGFGDIGTQVGHQLNKTLNMAISIVDDKVIKVMEAMHRRDFVAEAALKFSKLEFKDKAVLVIGTTGENSISRHILRKLPDGCIIVSTSSDQVEVDIKALEDMAGPDINEIEEGKTTYRIRDKSRHKTLTLLAEGYPINFYGSESLPNASIDPIMTLLLLCAVELCKGNIKRHRIDNEIVDKIVQENKLVEKFLQLSKHRRL